MSGIVGIFHLDDAPVDRQLLERLTNFLSFRGPDAQHTWSAGCVGFGHTLLNTTEGSQNESQPFTLDGNVWIVADARVDAQRDLIAELRARGQEPAPGATDAQLILRAYLAWGEACVEHLVGDFAFGIWDGPRRSLFCARDQMGVKPFYYAQIQTKSGSLVIFSNTLDCIRRHPAVSDRLNDLAVADFLLFWQNQEKDTTTFFDIQRIAPAHSVAWTPTGRRVSRYWTMPIDEPIFYKKADDYTDRFKELLRLAVSDRLRTSRVGILMSGGVDSTTLAAATCGLLRESLPTFDLKAFTYISSSLPEEREYAALASEHLGIPTEFSRSTNEAQDPHWEAIPFTLPEPYPTAYSIPAEREWWHAAATGRRVFFYGEGPDNALSQEWPPYIAYLIRTGRYGRLLVDSVATMIADRRPLFWGRTVRKLKRWVGVNDRLPPPIFPSWLDSEFDKRLNLRARWDEIQRPLVSAHLVRPMGYASMNVAQWQALFECMDAAATGVPLEVRHPYIDLRMLRFLLAVPAMPWCRNKYLIRRAMRGVLPPAILERKKAGVPDTWLLQRIQELGVEPLRPQPQLAAYLDLGHLPSLADGEASAYYDTLRVRSLNHWLQYSRRLPDNGRSEGMDHELIGKAVGRKEAV